MAANLLRLNDRTHAKKLSPSFAGSPRFWPSREFSERTTNKMKAGPPASPTIMATVARISGGVNKAMSAQPIISQINGCSRSSISVFQHEWADIGVRNLPRPPVVGSHDAQKDTFDGRCATRRDSRRGATHRLQNSRVIPVSRTWSG